MVGKYRVITLCGSTKFKDAFVEAQKRLTLEGNIVISVGLFGHSGDEEVWTEGTKEMFENENDAQSRFYDKMAAPCCASASVADRKRMRKQFSEEYYDKDKK